MGDFTSNPLLLVSAPSLIAGFVVIWQGRKTRRVNTEEHGGTSGKLDQVLAESKAAKRMAASAAATSSRTAQDVRVIKAEVAGLRDWRDEHTALHIELARHK